MTDNISKVVKLKGIKKGEVREIKPCIESYQEDKEKGTESDPNLRNIKRSNP